MKVWAIDHNGYRYFVDSVCNIIDCSAATKSIIDSFEYMGPVKQSSLTQDLVDRLNPILAIPYGDTKYAKGMPESHKRDCNVYYLLREDSIYLISETGKVVDPTSHYNICGFLFPDNDLGIDIDSLELDPKLSIPYNATSIVSEVISSNDNGSGVYISEYDSELLESKPKYSSRYEAMPHFMTYFNLTSEDMDSLKKLWHLYNLRSDDTTDRSTGNHYFLQGILEHCEVEWETWAPKMTPILFKLIYEDYPQLMVTNKQFKFN